jgi:hypothetical protein
MFPFDALVMMLGPPAVGEVAAPVPASPTVIVNVSLGVTGRLLIHLRPPPAPPPPPDVVNIPPPPPPIHTAATEVTSVGTVKE